MTQQSNKSTKRPHKLLIILLILLVLLAAAVAFILLKQSPAKSTQPLVTINSPGSGNLVEVNVPVQVMAQAENFPGVKRVEVYADGALIVAQVSDLKNGANPLVLNQRWTPLSLGRHALVARGYDVNGKFSDSSVVYVDVVELLTPTKKINVDNIDHSPQITSPSLNQIADAAGVTVDAINSANPDLGGTDPGVPLPPGTELNVPRNPAPAPTETGAPPIPMAGLPALPTNVSGTISCTTAQITWSASPDAQNGYVVYRIGPGDISPQRVGAVAAGTTSFSETISSLGTYRYQVAALRNGDEGLSAYFTGTMPDSCVPVTPNPDVVRLVLNVTGITTTQPYDGLYCYFSFDQGAHQRVPAGDFTSLIPDASGMNFNLQNQLPNRGLFVLTAHSAALPVTLGGECWGRLGVASLDLGSVSISLSPSEWDGSDRQSSVTQSVKVASLNNGPLTLVTFSLHYKVGYETTSTLRTFIPPYFGAVTDEELRPILQLDPSLLAPYDLAADFGGSVQCTPSTIGVICRAPSGLYLSWKYDGNRDLIGYFEYVISSSVDTSGVRLVGTPVVTQDTPVYHGITTANAQGVLINDISAVSVIENLLAQNCGSNNMIGYTIYALNKEGDPVSSAEAYLSAPPCDTQMAKVDVTLNSITFGPSSAHAAILDNDTCVLCTDNRIEMIGYAGLTAGGSSHSDVVLWQGSDSRADWFTLLMEWPLWQAKGLMGDVCGAQAAACAYGPNAATAFQWSDLQLQNSGGIGQTRNKISVNVRDGHTATLQIEVYDIPTGFNNGDDPLCVATITFPSNTAAEWQTIDEQQTISQDHGEASCTITYTVKGSTP